MKTLSIISLIVFLFPTFVGILKRRKNGIIISLLFVILLSGLIAGVSELSLLLSTKLEANKELCIKIAEATKYHRNVIDELVIPSLEQVFKGNAKLFFYIICFVLFLIICVLSGIFKKKKHVVVE